MLKKEVLEKELIANTLKNNVDISINNEFEYFQIHFTDKRLKFLEDFDSRYTSTYEYSETSWDLKVIFHTFCENIINKYFEKNKVKVSFGNKTIDVTLKTCDSIDDMDNNQCSILTSVEDDNLFSMNDIVATLIDIEELKKFYISNTDKLIKQYVEFFESERFYEDVCWLADNVVSADSEYDWETVYENLYFDMLLSKEIAHKGINKLQKRCKLKVTDFLLKEVA